MRPPVAKYFTIKAVLQARIERECVAGDRLPTEAALCRDFGVSRVTIQQALSLLAKEGLIRRKQGLGTFYVGPASPRTETTPSELLESVVRRDGFTKVIRKGVVVASPRIARRLGLPVGAQVVALDRVGFLDDEPIVFIQAYLPLATGVHVLDADEALRRRTVGSLLREAHGIPIESVVQTIAASLADPAWASLLGVEVGSAVLEGERTYLDDQGRPVFFSLTFYRADRHRFVVRLRDWRGGWDDAPGQARPAPRRARPAGRRHQEDHQ